MKDIYEMLRENIVPSYVDIKGSRSWEAQRCVDELEERDRKIERMQKHIDKLTTLNNQLTSYLKALKEAK